MTSPRFFNIPGPVLRSLIDHLIPSIAANSPLQAVLTSYEPTPYDAHRTLLHTRNLMDHSGVIDRGLINGLRIAAKPRDAFTMTVTAPNARAVLRYYSQKDTFVALSLDDPAECGISEPMPTQHLVDRFMATVGARAEGETATALGTHSGLLELLQILIDAEMPVDGEGPPLSRADVVTALSGTMGSIKDADEFAKGLIRDEVATGSKKGLAFASGFATWIAALRSGHRIHFTKTELGETEGAQLEVLFFGEKGKRRVMWPADDGVVLCAPDERQLRRMVGYMLGELGQAKEVLKVSRILRC